MNRSKAMLAVLLLCLPASRPWADESCVADSKSVKVQKVTPQEDRLLQRLRKDGCAAAAAAKLASSPQGNPSLIEVLKLAFGDNVRARGDRAKPPAPPTMPTGLILPTDGQIVFDPGVASSEGVTSLVITGPRVDLKLRPAGPTPVPSASFVPGDDYHWVLTTTRNAYDASFMVAGPEVAARVQARLAAVATVESDPSVRLALEAAVYDDEELFRARDQAIARLRGSLAP
jgi:hypothetical protein